MTCTLTRSLLPLALLLPLACTQLPGSDESSSDTDPTAGTSGPVEPDQWDDLVEPVAGSRLRPRFRVADDGTRAQVGWHDTMFDAPCEFRETSSAGLRCVPRTYGDDPWLYADPNCSEPVIQDIWIPEGATVVYAHGDSCFDSHYFEVGEPVGEIYYAANGPCEFFSNDPSHRVYAIPHDQFVGATLTPQNGNSRIVPLLLEADDGSRQIVGAWDREHEEEVEPAPDAASQLRWFGRREPRVSTYYYADASCTERVALAECVPGSEQPRTARETEPAPCLEFIGRHELLEELGGDGLYALRDGGCEPSGLSGSSSARVWRVGTPLDDAAFAEATAQNDGGARLRHDVFASPEGEPFLSSTRFYDLLMAETACSWRDPADYLAEAPSGSFDCFPQDGAYLDDRYLDADCVEQTASRFVDEESCPPPAQFSYSYVTRMVAALTGPTGGPGSYTHDDQDDCVPVEPEGESEDGGGFGEEEYYLVDGDSMVEAAHAVDVVE